MIPSLSVAPASFAGLDTPLLVLVLAAGQPLDDALGPVDDATGGALRRALTRRDFRGGRDETLHLSGPATGPQRILLVGMG